MSTIACTKKEFIEMIDELVEENKFIVFSNDLVGELKGATKKKNYKQASFAFASDAFKKPEFVSDFMKSFTFAAIILDEEHLSEEIKEKMAKKNEEKVTS